MRWSIMLVALATAVAIGAPAALATTASGSAGGLTVTVFLSPTATAGAPFTFAESIANTTTRRQLVRVTQTLSGENGEILSVSYWLVVPAGRTLSFSVTFTFPEVPPGTYSLTLTANAATATATTVVS